MPKVDVLVNTNMLALSKALKFHQVILSIMGDKDSLYK